MLEENHKETFPETPLEVSLYLCIHLYIYKYTYITVKHIKIKPLD